MPTSNVNITSAWSKIAESADTQLLVTWDGAVAVEFATTAADAAPTVKEGHALMPEDALTRSAIGTGYVWARVAPGQGSGLAGSAQPGAVLVVSK